MDQNDETTIKICFKKIKNKETTLISNFDEKNIEPFMKTLKKKFGCGGTIKTIKDKKIISLQGNHLDTLMVNRKELFQDLTIKKVDNL